MRSKYEFTYGTMSAWVKMPTQQGYWPAFWSLNNNRNGVDAAAIGEADVAEFYSTWPEAYHAVGHSWIPGGTNGGSADNYCPNATLTSSFNKYSATIEPGKVTFSINDTVCGTYTKTASQPWAFGPDVTRPNWMILNNAVDTRGGAEVVAPTQNSQLLVDRVEVRALPTTTPTPATPSALVDGSIYEVTNASSGKVAEIPAGTDYAKTATRSNSDTQRFQLIASDSGYYRLRNVTSGKVLSLPWTSSDDGVPIGQYANTGSPNADWRIVDLGNGVFQILNRTSGKAIGVQGNSTDAGVQIEQQTTDTAVTGQRWAIAAPAAPAPTCN